jgi:antitoxin CptB
MVGAKLDARRRRLCFRAWRRGTREADLLLGAFADAYIERLCEHDLAAFERLMDVADGDLFDWIAGRTPPPPEHRTPLLAAMIRFHHDHEQG